MKVINVVEENPGFSIFLYHRDGTALADNCAKIFDEYLDDEVMFMSINYMYQIIDIHLCY